MRESEASVGRRRPPVSHHAPAATMIPVRPSPTSSAGPISVIAWTVALVVLAFAFVPAAVRATAAG
ncbi:hypothetical protein [Streptomyces sp. NBC_00459]|uniref:hypothetical protein n=1 Tax=Streptomyces sp. NBC_00459 TaxID=2975749 RepID=UPI002E19AC5A